ncbi:MAG: PRC-barrel domain-containing protein [Mycobacteriales bacterium]
MRASELLGKEVRDRDGTPVGVVTDLRCVQDGPPRGHLAALRVDALLISRAHSGTLLGYDRGRSQGPALLRAIVRRLHRGARTIDWDRVSRYDGDAVELDLSLGPVSPGD